MKDEGGDGDRKAEPEAVLSDRDGRDARAPWPRANSLTK